MTEHEHKQKYKYFVDGVEYTTDLDTITGAQIKAKIQNFNPSYALVLEGHGDKPNEQISDSTSITFSQYHYVLHFQTVPPATFGCA